jgi:aminoglycoside phosphotransferase (APT) family kinase protein
METEPDGVEAVATAEEGRHLASPPLLIVDAVEHYFDAQGLGAGPIRWGRIGGGQSNVTYRIERGCDVFVLRRGPRPPLARSTHDMVREARILRLVGASGTPVPRILAVCDDESVLGVPFYVMEFVEGVIITDDIPAGLFSFADRRATSETAVDELVRLHRIDVSSGDLATLGRPAGYLERQVRRFAALWDVNATRDVPEVARISAWLAGNMPHTQAHSVVHGDYRLGNLMFAADEPARVVSILDWEMATLGDPLADLGYLTATYAEPGGFGTPLELTTVTREPGYLSRAELVERYRQRMPFDLDPLPWYQALALWKAAIFSEAIYTRWLSGERPDDTVFGPSLEAGVPRLLEAAMGFAGLAAPTDVEPAG